jgi:hypothetical protein
MEPGIFHIHHYHDDNCKTLLTRNMDDCKCRVEIKVQKSVDIKELEQIIKDDMRQYKKRVAENN